VPAKVIERRLKQSREELTDLLGEHPEIAGELRVLVVRIWE
jgi:hypothetical protein